MQNTKSLKALKYILKLKAHKAKTSDRATMPLHRSDYDQAARYLEYACELLERQAFGQTMAARDVLQLAVRRLSPGDHFVGDAAAEITVLRQVAETVPVSDARTEILKAIAVLRDRALRTVSPTLARGSLDLQAVCSRGGLFVLSAKQQAIGGNLTRESGLAARLTVTPVTNASP